jgi:hypothetical protein
MPIAKYTMLFGYASNLSGGSQGHRTGGWSESVYDASPVNQTAIDLFKVLQMKRAPLLGSGALIVGQRYQNIDPLGGSTTGSDQYPGNVTYPSDVPQLSLLGRIGAQVRANFRALEIRGIPDSLAAEGEYKPDSVFPTLLSDYIAALSGNWYFRGRDLATPRVPIIKIEGASGIVAVAADFTVAPGDLVQIIRTRDDDGKVFGSFNYIAATPAPTARQFSLSDYIGGDAKGGSVRLALKVLGLFRGGSFSIRGIAVRKVGRSFFQYRGRASVRH